jgi:hypothetical protein
MDKNGRLAPPGIRPFGGRFIGVDRQTIVGPADFSSMRCLWRLGMGTRGPRRNIY